MTRDDVTPREIRALLQQRLPELLHKLFPRYSVSTPVMTPLNPTRNDRRPGSFVIWTAGAAAGGFNEYSPRGPAASGDVIDLIAYVHRRAGDRRFALAYARDFLNLKQLDAGGLRAAKQQAVVHVQQTAAADSEAAAAKIKRANELWSKRLPLAGSLAETYLASRRIPLILVQNRESDLGFLPRIEHWKSAQWDGDKKIADGPRLPAMIAAMRNGVGDITAAHLTFLRQDGSGKADVPQPKLMRGHAKGSAIWLARGPSNLTVAEAQAAGLIEPLIVAEGIENGLTNALACPQARVCAAGSFDLMMALDVTPDCFDPVFYAVDNDDDVRHEDVLADRLDALRMAGKRATVMTISGAKDSNALLQSV